MQITVIRLEVNGSLTSFNKAVHLITEFTRDPEDAQEFRQSIRIKCTI